MEEKKHKNKNLIFGHKICSHELIFNPCIEEDHIDILGISKLWKKLNFITIAVNCDPIM